MLGKYTFWLKMAITFQLLTGVFHGIGLFVQQEPANDTERQLLDLMNNYHMELGAGFTPSTHDLFTALSACMTLLCFLGGLLNWHLLRKRAVTDILKGVVGINVLIFGVCFALMVRFTFLPPIVCTGLIFITLVLAWMTMPKAAGSQ